MSDDLVLSHEDKIQWMYCDSRGNVTFGVGHLLSAAKSATEFEWLLDGKVAPAQVVENAWYSVKAAFRKGYSAHYYLGISNLRASDETIMAAYEADKKIVVHGLCELFPDYYQYPQCAQRAIQDMCFNLGLPRLTREFPRFCAAVQARDWTEAANQCHRLPPVSEERNEDTYNLLMEAEK